MVNRVARDDGDAADYARNPRGRKQMLRDSGLTRECERNEDVFYCGAATVVSPATRKRICQ